MLTTSTWVTPLVRDLPPSGIRKFFNAAEGNKEIISLGVGEPDFATPKAAREACIRALERGRTMYTPNEGLMELREEIAAYLDKSFGVRYEPAKEVLVTVGGSEAIDLAMRALLEPGDEMIIPVPGYIAYAPICKLNGGVPVELEMAAAQSFKLTADALRQAITPRSKVLFVNFPSNPTGAVMSYEDWLPITKLVEEHNLIVLSDEIYAELTYEGKHVSFASLPGMKERTVVISGFSKAFAMTGMRVGYACGGQELIAAMTKIHQYTALCAPIVGQVAAIECLRSCMEDKDEMVEAFNQRRRMFVKGLSELGLACRDPQGAFYAFPSIAATGLGSEQFATRLLQEAKVAAVPGSVFGRGGEGFIRCSYASSTSNLSEALERIGRWMRTAM
ncbi:aminotransferase class I/II-fold pyridoxal phosphate-dependent enzyme [Paenibacillus glycanilyticus]|uniref:aminotransferase class I/II-fold pyridoxal phosphate-dependent enzyme n=1 Tax=Paenibacillus glycanilyticus TaxID=126569 RepID=UPI00190FF5B6|nr:aminotransferase class I/II-fold pyridoxal phosphate-dependent enzyme [Paenibacillus glycanilyticus]